MTAQELCDIIVKAKTLFMATVDGDQPKNRPISGHFIDGERVIFGIGGFKDVYRQLAANPKLEFVGLYDGVKWLRLTGRAVFDEGAEREAHQEKMLETLPFLRKIYNPETNYKLMTFHLEDATAEVVNFMPPGEMYSL
ncbi:MAG: pyridoxamine 5'-phosphate oxidase family protein [Kiritimatiellae bacterium]|nr:pyridoxamine 5'-phosphate oxidase family protein [Kiritimatiellia bacterium]